MRDRRGDQMKDENSCWIVSLEGRNTLAPFFCQDKEPIIIFLDAQSWGHKYACRCKTHCCSGGGGKLLICSVSWSTLPAAGCTVLLPTRITLLFFFLISVFGTIPLQSALETDHMCTGNMFFLIKAYGDTALRLAPHFSSHATGFNLL